MFQRFELGINRVSEPTDTRFIPRFFRWNLPLKAQNARAQLLTLGEVRFIPYAEKSQSNACTGSFLISKLGFISGGDHTNIRG